MKIGLIARSEDCGLGTMTEEFYKHMKPERTLLVDPLRAPLGLPAHYDRFPDALIAPWVNQKLDDRTVARFLEGLDVVYTAETFYDDRVVQLAHDLGVRTVMHAMPEYYRRPVTMPDAVWNPTSWLATGDLSHVVPVPAGEPDASLDCGSCEDPGLINGPLRVLHVAGRYTNRDRNGTDLFIEALRQTPANVVATLYMTPTLDKPVTYNFSQLPSNVELRVRGHVDGRWDMFVDQDLMVLPRRYGGLCLPVHEANAAGVPVVMPHCEPNARTWPIIPAHCEPDKPIKLAGGQIPTFTTDATSIAVLLHHYGEYPEDLMDARQSALAWAQTHSWPASTALYLRELESVLE